MYVFIVFQIAREYTFDDICHWQEGLKLQAEANEEVQKDHSSKALALFERAVDHFLTSIKCEYIVCRTSIERPLYDHFCTCRRGGLPKEGLL